MEGVEEANRGAVESCKKLVVRLSQSGDPFRLAAVTAETDEAVSRFDKVVTILSKRVGHARVRLGKRSSPPVHASCLLDHPLVACPPSNGFHGSSTTPALPPPQTRSFAPPSMHEKEVVPVPVVVAVAPCAILPAAKVDRNMFLETPLLDLNGCSVPPSAVSVQNSSKVCAAPAVNHPSCTTQIQFHHHHQQQQQQQQQQPKETRFQFDQKPSEKFHIEMPPRSGCAKEPEVITFSFDNNSVCTSSAATTSFFTSISSQLISMSDAATNPAAAPSRKAHCARKAEDSDGKCHCPKKKKPREKRVVRMPAISDKVADIPEDNYSWRKYGQKPIKGSPHPRGYYRCSSMKDCPARKHVERCPSDPGMMIVTYENEHNHAQPLDLSMLAANSEA